MKRTLPRGWRARLATHHGISRAYAHDIFHGRRHPLRGRGKAFRLAMVRFLREARGV